MLKTKHIERTNIYSQQVMWKMTSSRPFFFFVWYWSRSLNTSKLFPGEILSMHMESSRPSRIVPAAPRQEGCQWLYIACFLWACCTKRLLFSKRIARHCAANSQVLGASSGRRCFLLGCWWHPTLSIVFPVCPRYFNFACDFPLYEGGENR